MSPNSFFTSEAPCLPNTQNLCPVADGGAVPVGFVPLRPGEAKQTDRLRHLGRFFHPDESDVVPVAALLFGEVIVSDGRTDGDGLDAEREVDVEVGVAQDHVEFDGHVVTDATG